MYHPVLCRRTGTRSIVTHLTDVIVTDVAKLRLEPVVPECVNTY